jgi:flagellar assembly protein FliH
MSEDSQDIRPFSMESVNICAEVAPCEQNANGGSERRKTEEETYKSGFADGLHAGRLQILGDINNELKILRSLVEGIERVREEIYEKIEADVVGLALLVARKIVYEVAEHDRKVAVETAKEAIRKASDREMLKIKINPVDYEVLSKKRTELLQCFDGIKSIVFEEDESIQPGGCLIETNQGDIDARIESRLRVLGGVIRDNHVKS